MRQTYTGSMECLLVDDCGQDSSMAIAEKIISEYEGPIQFKILHHQLNRGLSAARNTGIREAKGDYLYFFDSDDVITPDCIEVLAEIAAKAPDADMVIGNYKCVPESLQNTLLLDMTLPEEMDNHEQIATAFLSHRIPMNAWNKLLKRSFVLEHNLFFNEGIVFEDVHWTFYVTKYLNSIRIHKGVTYYYNIRQSSIVNSTKPMVVGNSYLTIYEDILQHLTKRGERRELSCYVEGFCNRYLLYRTIIPKYEGIYNLYYHKAQEYGCKGVVLKLRLTHLMGKVPFGMGTLKMMKSTQIGVSKIAKRCKRS